MSSKPQKINKTTKLIDDNAFYQRISIRPELQLYIKSIEIELGSLDNAHDLLPYQVLPDCSVVMGFQYRGAIHLINGSEKRRLAICGISGLQTQHKLFQVEDLQTKSILVRLYALAINVLFNESAYHFTNQALSLRELVNSSSILHLEEQLASTVEPEALSHAVQNFLFNLLLTNQKKMPPTQVIAMSRQLSCSDEVSSIAKLAEKNRLSIRSLERQFKHVLELSPKKFLRLCQFQRAIEQLRNGESWWRVIERLNYYDQAHFINSFKQFSGLTPSQFKISSLLSYFSNTTIS